jgi:hypothetical protein
MRYVALNFRTKWTVTGNDELNTNLKLKSGVACLSFEFSAHENGQKTSRRKVASNMSIIQNSRLIVIGEIYHSWNWFNVYPLQFVFFSIVHWQNFVSHNSCLIKVLKVMILLRIKCYIDFPDLLIVSLSFHALLQARVGNQRSFIKFKK